MEALQLLDQATEKLDAEAAKHAKLVKRANRSQLDTLAHTVVVEGCRAFVYAKYGERLRGDHRVCGDAAAAGPSSLRSEPIRPPAGEKKHASHNSWAKHASRLTKLSAGYYLNMARFWRRLGPLVYGKETFDNVELMFDIVSAGDFMTGFALLLREKCDGAASFGAVEE